MIFKFHSDFSFHLLNQGYYFVLISYMLCSWFQERIDYLLAFNIFYLNRWIISIVLSSLIGIIIYRYLYLYYMLSCQSSILSSSILILLIFKRLRILSYFTRFVRVELMLLCCFHSRNIWFSNLTSIIYLFFYMYS